MTAALQAPLPLLYCGSHAYCSTPQRHTAALFTSLCDRACRAAGPALRTGSRPSGEESKQINEAKSAELAARLPTLPISKWHRNFFILGFLGVLYAAADV